jgi:hypothetical protein
MSPPDTNIQKQERRHRPTLLGIAISLMFAALLAFIFLTYVTDPDQTLIENGPTSEPATATE